jgi:hypothetical protein
LFIGLEHELDQFFATRLFEIFRRHTFFLLQRTTHSKTNAIEYEAKRLVGDLLRRIRRRKAEAPPLELLRIQAEPGSIPRQDLHVVGLAVNEDEEGTRVRIFIGEDVLHQGE